MVGRATAGPREPWPPGSRPGPASRAPKPGTSALFLVVEKVTPDKAVEGLRQFGGTVLKSSLSKDAEAQLQDALQGEATA